MVYGIDPSGHTILTPPYRLDAGLALQGDCGSTAAGCGAWRSLPALGPDGTVYVAHGRTRQEERRQHRRDRR